MDSIFDGVSMKRLIRLAWVEEMSGTVPWRTAKLSDAAKAWSKDAVEDLEQEISKATDTSDSTLERVRNTASLCSYVLHLPNADMDKALKAITSTVAGFTVDGKGEWSKDDTSGVERLITVEKDAKGIRVWAEVCSASAEGAEADVDEALDSRTKMTFVVTTYDAAKLVEGKLPITYLAKFRRLCPTLQSVKVTGWDDAGMSVVCEGKFVSPSDVAAFVQSLDEWSIEVDEDVTATRFVLWIGYPPVACETAAQAMKALKAEQTEGMRGLAGANAIFGMRPMKNRRTRPIRRGKSIIDSTTPTPGELVWGNDETSDN